MIIDAKDGETGESEPEISEFWGFTPSQFLNGHLLVKSIDSILISQEPKGLNEPKGLKPLKPLDIVEFVDVENGAFLNGSFVNGVWFLFVNGFFLNASFVNGEWFLFVNGSFENGDSVNGVQAGGIRPFGIKPFSP